MRSLATPPGRRHGPRGSRGVPALLLALLLALLQCAPGVRAGTADNRTRLAAGYYHICLWNAFEIRCFGGNNAGQCGRGDISVQGVAGDDTSPVILPTAKRGVPIRQVSLGKLHTCILFDDGDLIIFGGNEMNERGRGDTDTFVYSSEDLESLDPLVFPPDQDQSERQRVAAISCAGRVSAALLEDGRLFVWGYCHFGQCGQGSTTDKQELSKSRPVELAGIQSIACSDTFCGAVLRDGTARLWGNNNDGRLGIGESTTEVHDAMSPLVLPLDTKESIETLLLGGKFGCARTSADRVFCWGENRFGQLGWTCTADQVGASESDMHSITPMEEAQRHVAIGYEHQCSFEPGTPTDIKCVGQNNYGALGWNKSTKAGSCEKKATFDDTLSVSLPMVTNDSIVDVACALRHTCVLMASDRVMCWGKNILKKNNDGSDVTGTLGGGDQKSSEHYGKDGNLAEVPSFIINIRWTTLAPTASESPTASPTTLTPTAHPGEKETARPSAQPVAQPQENPVPTVANHGPPDGSQSKSDEPSGWLSVEELTFVLAVAVLAIMVLLTMMINYQSRGSRRGTSLLPVMIALFDFATDALFASSLSQGNRRDLYNLCLAFIILPIFGNFVATLHFINQKTAEDVAFRRWANEHLEFLPFVCFLSLFNFEAWRITTSNLLHRDAFNAPIKTERYYRSIMCRALLNNVLEDIPQLLIVVALLNDPAEELTVASAASLAVSIFSIIYTLLARLIPNVVASSKHLDADASDWESDPREEQVQEQSSTWSRAGSFEPPGNELVQT